MAAGVHLAVALSFGSPALAQTPATPTTEVRAQAAELKKKGDYLMENIKYDEAFAAYSDAYNLAAEPALLYNMGRALQALSRFPEALALFERFEKAAPPELKAKVPKLNELLQEVRARTSTLQVICNVAGARILVRDRVVGITPLAGPIQVVSGAGGVEVDAEGYLSIKQEVLFPGAGETTLKFDLMPARSVGMLVVRTLPSEAAVVVDGKTMGHAPVETVLSVGPHRIKVTHDGYGDAETSATVPLNGRQEITLRLEKTPPIVARWWFWAGVGVVVAGGVVLTVALLTEKGASHGDLPPGQVSGPLLRF